MSQQSKKIFITGGSSGLGEGMARHLAARGHKLALAARRRERLEALAQELESTPGGRPLLFDLDVTEYETVAGVVEDAAQQLGGLDIVVANAGVAGSRAVGSDDLAAVSKIIDTNVTGFIATVDAAVAQFRKQGHGHVVGISSVAGVRGMKNSGVYSASKAAVSRYLEAVRIETLADNIRVTEMAPGYIDTDLNRSLKTRPFLVSGEAGTKAMADMIEAEVAFRYVPVWPWTIVAQALKWLPNSVIARM
jgi:NADP-dependent 3-hydroxy acid dehydrogenase YdfG